MDFDNLIRSGTMCLVLGPNHYKKVFSSVPKNKLIKISKYYWDKDKRPQAETQYTSLIKSQIKDHNNYYCIPDEATQLITTNSRNYGILMDIIQSQHMSDVLNATLEMSYVDYAGNKELLETIGDMASNNYFKFWKSKKTILEFATHIMKGLNYLHNLHICHLDVKAENIMVNTYTREFKLIDFGFASAEPFDDYLRKIRGTPGYFPKYFPNEKITAWLPKIEANDMIPDFGSDVSIPIVADRKLVYKIDSFCFGRTLYFLKYIYDTYSSAKCFCKETKINKKLNYLLDHLLEKDVRQRLTINEALKLI